MRPSEKLLELMVAVEKKYIGRIHIDNYELTVIDEKDSTLRDLFEDIESIRPEFEKMSGIARLTETYQKAAQKHRLLLESVLLCHPEWSYEAHGYYI